MMKKKHNLWGLTGPLFFSVFLVVGVAGCGEEDSAPVASPELLDSGAESVIYRMVTLLTTNGIQEARVEADTAYSYPDSSLYSLRNPTLVLYTPQGSERARVVAERGWLNLGTKELVARGNVILTIPEGDRRVESQELNYDPNGDKIWSDSASVMWEGTTVTRGESFESDLEFRRAVVLNGSITQTGEAPPPNPSGRVPPGG
jgi:LPS export ABC transporter protein LptC